MALPFRAFPRPTYTLEQPQYPDPPPWWVQSLAEWVVYWWLTTQRRPPLRAVGPNVPPQRGATFFYQVRVPVLGVFAETDAVRVDFLLPGFGSAGYEALVLDPYNTFTHKSVDLDYTKRDVLAQQAQIQLIWLETGRLEAGDTSAIAGALLGRDESPRAVWGI